jgi:hypothetical protein
MSNSAKSGNCEIKFVTQTPEPKNSQILPATPYRFYAQFWYSKVELDHLGTRSKYAMSRVLSLKTARPKFTKRVQLGIYRSYDHKFLRAKTRLDMEQLWYRSTSLIIPRIMVQKHS